MFDGAIEACYIIEANPNSIYKVLAQQRNVLALLFPESIHRGILRALQLPRSVIFSVPVLSQAPRLPKTRYNLSTIILSWSAEIFCLVAFKGRLSVFPSLVILLPGVPMRCAVYYIGIDALDNYTSRARPYLTSWQYSTKPDTVSFPSHSQLFAFY